MGTLTKNVEVVKDPADRRLPCRICIHSTNHTVLYSETTRWGEDLGDGMSIDGADTYSLVQCQGCDDVRMVHEHWFSEDWDDEGGPVQHRDYHPPNITRHKPDWVRNGLAPDQWGLRDIVDEIYLALGVEAYRVAMMGIRALVEHIMVDQVGDQGTFAQNLKLFFEKGYVAAVQQAMFQEILLEAGHAAMHRGWAPTREDVDTLLDIIEALLKAIYVDPSRTVKVKVRIPPRSQRDGNGRSQ